MKEKLSKYFLATTKILFKTLVGFAVLVIVIFAFITYGFTKIHYYDIESELDYYENRIKLTTMNDYSSNGWEKHIVNGTLFYADFDWENSLECKRKHPVFNRMFHETYTYSFSCRAIQQNGARDRAVVNSVIIEPVVDVDFDKITYEKDIVFEFKSSKEKNNLQFAREKILNPISEKDIGLTDNSLIKVTMNVTVGEGEKAVTKDLIYEYRAMGKRFYLGLINAT